MYRPKKPIISFINDNNHVRQVCSLDGIQSDMSVILGSKFLTMKITIITSKYLLLNIIIHCSFTLEYSYSLNSEYFG